MAAFAKQATKQAPIPPWLAGLTAVRGRVGAKGHADEGRRMFVTFTNELPDNPDVKHLEAQAAEAAREQTQTSTKKGLISAARSWSSNPLIVCITHGEFEASTKITTSSQKLSELDAVLENMGVTVKSTDVCAEQSCCVTQDAFDGADMEALKKLTPSVVWRRSADINHAVAVTPPGKWVVQTSPMFYLGISTAREKKYIEYLAACEVKKGIVLIDGEEKRSAHSLLASREPEQLLRLTELANRPVKGGPIFTPPGQMYPNKIHVTYDSPKKDMSTMWAMLCLPLFQPTDINKLAQTLPPLKSLERDERHTEVVGCPGFKVKINTKVGFKFVADADADFYANASVSDVLHRIINNRLLQDDNFWTIGPENPYWPTYTKTDVEVKQGTARVGDKLPPPVNAAGQTDLPSAGAVGALRTALEHTTAIWNRAAVNAAIVAEAKEAQEAARARLAAAARWGWLSAYEKKYPEIYLSTMLNLFPPCTFWSLTCSPPAQTDGGGEKYVENQLSNKAFGTWAMELGEVGLDQWKAIFTTTRGAPPRGMRVAPAPILQVELDTFLQEQESTRENPSRGFMRRLAEEGFYMTAASEEDSHSADAGGAKAQAQQEMQREFTTAWAYRLRELAGENPGAGQYNFGPVVLREILRREYLKKVIEVLAVEENTLVEMSEGEASIEKKLNAMSAERWDYFKKIMEMKKNKLKDWLREQARAQGETEPTTTDEDMDVLQRCALGLPEWGETDISEGCGGAFPASVGADGAGGGDDDGVSGGGTRYRRKRKKVTKRKKRKKRKRTRKRKKSRRKRRKTRRHKRHTRRKRHRRRTKKNRLPRQ